MKKEEWYL